MTDIAGGHVSDRDPDLHVVRVPVTTMWASPEAPRPVDRPTLSPEPDVAAWAAGLTPQECADLHGRTLTQLLLGERVRVLEEDGNWVRAVALQQPSSGDPRGYPGWLRRHHLSAPADEGGSVTALVTARTASCHREDGRNTPLSFGTALPVASLAEPTVTVLLPGGGSGTLPLTAVSVVERSEPARWRHEELPDRGRQLLGQRYVWGGTSAWGLDCSAVVHLTYRSYGVTVPRDASDQAEHAQPVPMDEVRPGDLYFFARRGAPIHHVGFATRPVEADGTRWMLHAPETGGRVEDRPMPPERQATLVGAGRIAGSRS